MLSLPQTRTLYFLGFLVCAALISYALYMQFVLYYEPCPLCIFQRIAFLVIGLLCLAAAIQNPEEIGNRIYAVLIGLTALVGLSLSLRHSWLQHNPPEFVECGGDLEYWLETLPVGKIMQKVLAGTGDCTDVVWKFLGLSIPEWTAIMFFGFILFAVRQFHYRSLERY